MKSCLSMPYLNDSNVPVFVNSMYEASTAREQKLLYKLPDTIKYRVFFSWKLSGSRPYLFGIRSAFNLSVILCAVFSYLVLDRGYNMSVSSLKVGYWVLVGYYCMFGPLVLLFVYRKYSKYFGETKEIAMDVKMFSRRYFASFMGRVSLTDLFFQLTLLGCSAYLAHHGLMHTAAVIVIGILIRMICYNELRSIFKSYVEFVSNPYSFSRFKREKIEIDEAYDRGVEQSEDTKENKKNS